MSYKKTPQYSKMIQDFIEFYHQQKAQGLDPLKDLFNSIDKSEIEEDFENSSFKRIEDELDSILDYDLYEQKYSTYEEEPCTLPGLPLGELGVLFGEGGVGKSYLILQLAISLATRGSKFDLDLFKNLREEPNHQVNKVIYFSLEDTEKTIRNRLINIRELTTTTNPKVSSDLQGYDELMKSISKKILIIGADKISNIQPTLILNAETNSRNVIIKNHHIFERLIVKMYGRDMLDGSLIIFDPLSNLYRSNENDNVEMSALMHHLITNIARKYNCSILVSHHSNKSNEGGSASARGASAITANSRWAARLSHDKDYTVIDPKAEKAIKFDIVKINHGEAYSQNFLAMALYRGAIKPVKFNQKPTSLKPEKKYKSYDDVKIVKTSFN